jgi:hypothetical protein
MQKSRRNSLVRQLYEKVILAAKRLRPDEPEQLVALWAHSNKVRKYVGNTMQRRMAFGPHTMHSEQRKVEFNLSVYYKLDFDPVCMRLHGHP